MEQVNITVHKYRVEVKYIYIVRMFISG